MILRRKILVVVMEKWVIEYGGDGAIEKWFDLLSKEQFKSVAKELKLLEICGNKLKLPHSRSLGKGLFELRERRYGYRIYYTFFREKTIILLEAGDKSTQKNDIKKARVRLIKVGRGDNETEKFSGLLRKTP